MMTAPAPIEPSVPSAIKASSMMVTPAVKSASMMMPMAV